MLAALGVGIGSLVRSQLATVIGIFVWAIIVESVIGGLYTEVRPYLPYTAATTLAGARSSGTLPLAGPRAEGRRATAVFAAVGVIGAIALVVSLTAARTTVRRDIT